jgi:uncharacterized membrane protein (DUF2068 family)
MFPNLRRNKSPRVDVTLVASPFRPLGLFLIGLFKTGKAFLFVALGIGMLKLIDKDIDDIFRDLILKLHIDAEHRFIQHILTHLSVISNHTLQQLSMVSFIFSALLFVEAIGLFAQKVWAEFMTIAETSLFIPFEIYEIIRHGTLVKVVIMIVNMAIVGYLVWAIARKSNKPQSA